MFSIISRWRLFKKMGYKGWYFLIPFYNSFCMFEAVWGNGWKMFLPLWSIVIVIIGFIMTYSARQFYFIPLAIIVAVVYLIVLYAAWCGSLTNSFKKDGWWTVGTFFFYPIMLIVYGISDLAFKEKPFPDYENYDAIDGFVDFFRKQNPTSQKAEVKRCSKCGAILRDGAKYCYECGNVVE